MAPSSGEETLVVDSVVVTDGNLVVTFTGTPGASYKLTESADLVAEFVDTDPLQSVTTDGTTGVGTLSLPVTGDKNFVRVESN